MLYYFAYGSNMDLQQMTERCPESKFICKAVLRDYRIGFTIFSPLRKCGCADIIACKGDEVWGLLFKISEADRCELDKREGHPNKYRRHLVTVFDAEQTQYSADVYEVVSKEEKFLKPSRHYLGLMQSAAIKFNFPETYKNLLLDIETLD